MCMVKQMFLILQADLVKALLNSNAPVIMDKSELKENERSTRRMTRSRVSIYQHPNDVQDIESKLQIVNTKKHSLTIVNDLVEEDKNKTKRQGKRKRESVIPDSLSDMFRIVSSIATKSKPLVEITNKTESNIGETNQSDGTEKTFNKKSRRSQLKTTKSTLRNKKEDVKTYTEDDVNIHNNSVPKYSDKNESNDFKTEKEDNCSEHSNNALEVKDIKSKRKGRKKKLEEQINIPAEVKATGEMVDETAVNEVNPDPNEKPKVEKKKRLQKQKKEVEICLNLEDNSKNNSGGEVKISDSNSSKESEFGNQKKRRGKSSKSKVVEVSGNKDISGVLTLSGTSPLNIQNSSTLDEQLVNVSIDKKRSSRTSKVSIEESVVKNRNSVLDLFADDMVDADYENLSNTSGKSEYMFFLFYKLFNALV